MKHFGWSYAEDVLINCAYMLMVPENSHESLQSIVEGMSDDQLDTIHDIFNRFYEVWKIVNIKKRSKKNLKERLLELAKLGDEKQKEPFHAELGIGEEKRERMAWFVNQIIEPLCNDESFQLNELT